MTIHKFLDGCIEIFDKYSRGPRTTCFTRVDVRFIEALKLVIDQTKDTATLQKSSRL